MGLFKALWGPKSRISKDITPFHNGYVYLTTDDGGLYADVREEDGTEKRIRVEGTPEVVWVTATSGLSDGTPVHVQADMNSADIKAAVDSGKMVMLRGSGSKYFGTFCGFGQWGDFGAPACFVLGPQDATIGRYAENISGFELATIDHEGQVTFTSASDVFIVTISEDPNNEYNFVASMTGYEIEDAIYKQNKIPMLDFDGWPGMFYGGGYDGSVLFRILVAEEIKGIVKISGDGIASVEPDTETVIATVTLDPSNNTQGTADMTYSEMEDAFKLGRVVMMKINNRLLQNRSASGDSSEFGGVVWTDHGPALLTAGYTTGNQVTIRTDELQTYIPGTAGQAVRFDASGALVAADVDTAPTADSKNPVTSGGIHTALTAKQDKLTGAEGKIVRFNASGTPVASDESKPVQTSITLTVAGWDVAAKTQTVTVPGILADESKQLIQAVAPSASRTAYNEAGVQAISQAENSLTFTCKKVPTDNLNVFIVVTELETA